MLFNEPKLLKSEVNLDAANERRGFSALQRAEIAEIWQDIDTDSEVIVFEFQCSSTSRNC